MPGNHLELMVNFVAVVHFLIFYGPLTILAGYLTVR